MDTVEMMVPFTFLVIPLVGIAWYVAVTILLYKIWRKVRHLPG